MADPRIALLSVSDKTGIVELARGLVALGWQIVSTGGTAAELGAHGIPVRDVTELTGVPELLGGRVKTLHPSVHAGLLARRSLDEDMGTLDREGIQPIDLVAVNLYSFRETVTQGEVSLAEAVEQIDIGGPAMLRAAAKNHEWVLPLCDPADYEEALRLLDGQDAAEDAALRRRELAAKVYRHTAVYDAAVSRFLASLSPSEPGPPAQILLSLQRSRELRYGENPDQRAALYGESSGESWGIAKLEQLHGKEPSYNNLLDVDGALAAIAPFLGSAGAACAIVKHTTPCGLAVAGSAAEAFERALACDPTSAFGSTVAFNRPLTESVAEALLELFVECLVAPGYAEGALRMLRSKVNLRILAPEDGRIEAYPGQLLPGFDARGVQGGLLLQSAPMPAAPGGFEDGTAAATSRAPTPEEWSELGFAWAAAQAVKSNAILLAREAATIGIGAGQMSRVDAVKLAGWKAREAGHDPAGSVLASDAFFPFRDGVDVAAELGVGAIVQPGGSIRDDEVVAAADEHGMAMVMTGRRLFRH